jgi:hypothetical protein
MNATGCNRRATGRADADPRVDCSEAFPWANAVVVFEDWLEAQAAGSETTMLRYPVAFRPGREGVGVCFDGGFGDRNAEKPNIRRDEAPMTAATSSTFAAFCQAADLPNPIMPSDKLDFPDLVRRNLNMLNTRVPRRDASQAGLRRRALSHR